MQYCIPLMSCIVQAYLIFFSIENCNLPHSHLRSKLACHSTTNLACVLQISHILQISSYNKHVYYTKNTLLGLFPNPDESSQIIYSQTAAVFFLKTVLHSLSIGASISFSRVMDREFLISGYRIS